MHNDVLSTSGSQLFKIPTVRFPYSEMMEETPDWDDEKNAKIAAAQPNRVRELEHELEELQRQKGKTDEENAALKNDIRAVTNEKERMETDTQNLRRCNSELRQHLELAEQNETNIRELLQQQSTALSEQFPQVLQRMSRLEERHEELNSTVMTELPRLKPPPSRADEKLTEVLQKLCHLEDVEAKMTDMLVSMNTKEAAQASSPTSPRNRAVVQEIVKELRAGFEEPLQRLGTLPAAFEAEVQRFGKLHGDMEGVLCHQADATQPSTVDDSPRERDELEKEVERLKEVVAIVSKERDTFRDMIKSSEAERVCTMEMLFGKLDVANQQVYTLKAERIKQQEHFDEMRQMYRDETDSKDKRLAELDGRLQTKEAELAEQDRQIGKMRKELELTKAAESRLANANARAAESAAALNKEKEDVTARLADKDSEVFAANERERAALDHVEELEERVASLTKHVAELDAQLEQKDEALRKAQVEIQQEKEARRRLDDETQQRLTTLQALNDDIEEKTKIAAYLLWRSNPHRGADNERNYFEKYAQTRSRAFESICLQFLQAHQEAALLEFLKAKFQQLRQGGQDSVAATQPPQQNALLLDLPARC
ncbi:unnamed protein product [Vitrella brassicaformis CCMP3155]|uniref:Uncharacterized protein n=1 Tax=Vitrella brassicaformis (strain CCMP3155) TaxID=1169540 RepID=A0A0G4FEK4_VITBC|nr:unnamed protein product [Vitrella brassicaformis CCMP3155]|eukprot:CEM11404.1 unnamed protein product [Vitrella brassicaformis CCMP3155]